MASQPRPLADTDSMLSCLTPAELQVWEELDRDRAAAVARWVLSARWQRTRRERVGDVRRMLRLQVADVEPPDIATPRRWWELLLDPFIWWA